MTRRLVALGLGVLLVLAGARAADALFTTAATAGLPVTVAAPIAPRPASVNCATQGTALVAKWAHFTWTAPAGAPQPSQYVLRVLHGGVEREIARVAGTVTAYDVTTAVLTGALQFVLDALLGGGTRPVTVNAVYGSYESPSAHLHHLRSELGVLTGVGCGNGSAP